MRVIKKEVGKVDKIQVEYLFLIYCAYYKNKQKNCVNSFSIDFESRRPAFLCDVKRGRDKNLSR